MHVSWKDQRPRDSGKTVWISGGNSDGIDLEFSGHGKQRERTEGLMWKQHLMVSGRSQSNYKRTGKSKGKTNMATTQFV